MTSTRLSLTSPVGFLLMGLIICAPRSAQANTVGLYLFDDVVMTFPNGAGEQWVDSSGNGLHFVKQTITGTATMTDDVAPVMQPRGKALSNFGAGNAPIITPVSDLLLPGKTGQFTVEFWYRPQRVTELGAIQYIMAHDADVAGGTDAWGFLLRDTDFDDVAELQFFARNDAGTAQSLLSPEFFSDSTPWVHIAATVGAGGIGRLYINGSQVASGSGFNITSAPADTLRLGAAAGGGFVGGSFIDELRISDVALLPGGGTGVNELAWNTSLAPPFILGDMNADGVVDNEAIDPFTLAVNNPLGFRQAYVGINPDTFGDIDGNGAVQFADVDGFAQLLTGGPTPPPSLIPEPATGWLIILAAGIASGRSRRNA